MIPNIIVEAEKHLERVIATCDDPVDALAYIREYAYSAQIIRNYTNGLTLDELKLLIDEAILKYKENYTK